MLDENEANIQPSLDIPLAPVSVPGSREETTLPTVKNKGGRPAGLTKKARCFLELLCAGKGTVDAYKLAGYTGEDEAAYHLRSILKDQLYAMLKARGLSREGILLELKHLKESPTAEEIEGKPLTFDQKLALLKFLAKLVPERDMLAAPKVTPFFLNIEAADGVTIKGGGTDEEVPGDAPQGV